MIFICHRGKKTPIELENNTKNILKNINLGYECEIDVWKINNKFYLGHDKPEEEVDLSFLKLPKLWCHAKNIEAFYELLNNKIIVFWHQEDDYTTTSNGYIWTYPGKKLIKNCIAVKPEKVNYDLNDLKLCYAICTAEAEKYKYLLGD